MNSIELTTEQVSQIPSGKILFPIDVSEGYEYKERRAGKAIFKRCIQVYTYNKNEWRSEWTADFLHPLNTPLWVQEEWRLWNSWAFPDHDYKYEITYKGTDETKTISLPYPLIKGVRIARILGNRYVRICWQSASTMPKEFSRHTITFKSVDVVEIEGEYFWEGKI
jgi:hypothetical protein